MLSGGVCGILSIAEAEVVSEEGNGISEKAEEEVILAVVTKV